MVPMEISWSAKESNETMLREADLTRSNINRIRKPQATLFWLCNEQRETRTS